jgi:hypothetical protein
LATTFADQRQGGTLAGSGELGERAMLPPICRGHLTRTGAYPAMGHRNLTLTPRASIKIIWVLLLCKYQAIPFCLAPSSFDISIPSRSYPISYSPVDHKFSIRLDQTTSLHSHPCGPSCRSGTTHQGVTTLNIPQTLSLRRKIFLSTLFTNCFIFILCRSKASRICANAAYTCYTRYTLKAPLDLYLL